MNKTSSSSAALAASERSGEAANAAGAAPTALRSPVPDSEVVARPRRRRFTAEYKRSILDQADAAQDSRTVGALLRKLGRVLRHMDRECVAYIENSPDTPLCARTLADYWL